MGRGEGVLGGWETAGRVVGGWETAGRVVGGWETAGRVVGDSRESGGRQQGEWWETTGRVVGGWETAGRGGRVRARRGEWQDSNTRLQGSVSLHSARLPGCCHLGLCRCVTCGCWLPVLMAQRVSTSCVVTSPRTASALCTWPPRLLMAASRLSSSEVVVRARMHHKVVRHYFQSCQ